MIIKNVKTTYKVSKWQAWLYKRAPAWVIKEGDPRGTAVRMVLVVLSFAPLFGLLAIVYVGVAWFQGEHASDDQRLDLAARFEGMEAQ